MWGHRSSGVPSIRAEDVPAGAALVDVREDEEWEAGHAPGAVHIPMAQLPARLAEIPSEGEVVLVCRVGARSEHAAAWLLSQGRDAVNLEGGMYAWVEAGRPLVSDGGAGAYVA